MVTSQGQMPGAGTMAWHRLVLLMVIVVVGVQGELDPDSYVRSQQLAEGYMMYWTLDMVAKQIHIGIQVEAQGWLGFGISEVGGMKGADILYYEAEAGLVVDSHALAYATPVVDDCQDWVVRAGGVVNGKLFVEASRVFETGDTQDWRLVDDTGTNGHRFICAWGDSASMQYHGVRNRASGIVHFFGLDPPVDGLAAVKAMPGIESFDLMYKDWAIPEVTTTYDNVCWGLNRVMGLDNTDVPYHVVAFEPILHPGDWKYMHHITISGSTGSSTKMSTGSFCQSHTRGDGALVMAWAGENRSIILPEEAGIRLFGDDGWKSFSVQTHWNNPNHTPNVLANSGVRVWLTRNLRPMDVGVLQIGDPGVVLNYWEHVKMEAGWTSVHTTCPSTFTRQFSVSEVTVFARFMHMHLVGERFEARLKRESDVVRVDTVEVYDGLKSGGFDPISTGAGFKVRRGDWFEVDCHYQVPDGRTVSFGQGTQDEMCIDFLWYYPKQSIASAEACIIHGSNKATYDGKLWSPNASQSGRVFGLASEECGAVADPPVEGSGANGFLRLHGACSLALHIAMALWAVFAVRRGA